MSAGDYDFDINETGLQVGSVSRLNPYEGLTDEQADVLQAELEAAEARKVPLGFRATVQPRRRRDWPRVPRFDIRED